jgi:tetratricopeptide (TPR) repeat protein
MRTATLALLAAALIGCGSNEEAAEAPARAEGRRALVAWWVEPAASDVAAFRQRWDALGEAPACKAELVRREPEVALALFLSTEDAALRAAVGAALDAGGGDGCARSLKARKERPEAHAEARALWAAQRQAPAAEAAKSEAAEALRAAGDPFLADQADLHARAAALATGAEPMLRNSSVPEGAAEAARRGCSLGAATSAAMTPRLRLVELGEAQTTPEVSQQLVRAFVYRADEVDLTTLEHLESLRAVGAVTIEPAKLTGWYRGLATAALRRGKPLVALKHALALSAAWEREQTPDAAQRLRDRLLLSRAQLAAKQTEPALAEALDVAEDAAALDVADAALEAAARAQAGDALLEIGRADAALGAYDRAHAKALEAADEPLVFRQTLNRAAAFLRLSRPAEARAALDRLPQPPRGDDAVDLATRRTVLVALSSVLLGEATGQAAADRVDQALSAARDAGALDVVERFAGLPARLRAGPKPQGRPG